MCPWLKNLMKSNLCTLSKFHLAPKRFLLQMSGWSGIHLCEHICIICWENPREWSAGESLSPVNHGVQGNSPLSACYRIHEGIVIHGKQSQNSSVIDLLRDKSCLFSHEYSRIALWPCSCWPKQELCLFC